MYNYDKIRQEIENLTVPMIEPKQGDLYVGIYKGTTVPDGMSISYIELQQEHVTVYIPQTKSLERALTKANVTTGDHIALYVRGIHEFGAWGGKMPHWICKKLKEVDGEYE